MIILLLQEEAINQGLNLCGDDDLWLPPLDISLHLHNGWPGPVPQMVECVRKVVLGAVLPGTVLLLSLICLFRALRPFSLISPRPKPSFSSITFQLWA